MMQSEQRSPFERLVRRPVPWLAGVWTLLAVFWVVRAFVDPSTFHTSMAVVWSVLAAIQIGGVVHRRRQDRARPEDTAGRSVGD
jgi:hypothetical protein